MNKLSKKQKIEFKNIYPNANPLAIDLLTKMLEFNPRKRWTVEQCIAHPYFEGLHNPEDEPTGDKPFDWKFDEIELTKENLQMAIYQESLLYHPS